MKYLPNLLPFLWGSPWGKQKIPSPGSRASFAHDLAIAGCRGIWALFSSIVVGLPPLITFYPGLLTTWSGLFCDLGPGVAEA